jgi:hypothetical protein
MPGKKGRKIGRNKKWCEKYEKSGTPLLNKEIKQAKHRHDHPADTGQNGIPNYTRKKPYGWFEAPSVKKV